MENGAITSGWLDAISCAHGCGVLLLSSWKVDIMGFNTRALVGTVGIREARPAAPDAGAGT